MEYENIIAVLIENGSIQQTESGLTLAHDTRTQLRNRMEAVQQLPSDDYPSKIRELLHGEIPIRALTDLVVKDPMTFSELEFIADILDTGDPEVLLNVQPIMRLFRDHTDPTDGVPSPFVPAPGDVLGELAEIYSPMIAYIWLTDCNPCDKMVKCLEKIFPNSTTINRYAVYGPNYQDVLAEDFAVTAGPALLFMSDGRVDSRLYGAHEQHVIEQEIESLLV